MKQLETMQRVRGPVRDTSTFCVRSGWSCGGEHTLAAQHNMNDAPKFVGVVGIRIVDDLRRNHER